MRRSVLFQMKCGRVVTHTLASSCPSRAGRAVRLTYDHKGSDAKEAKRITDAGGFVMNNRVNGQSPPLCQVNTPKTQCWLYRGPCRDAIAG